MAGSPVLAFGAPDLVNLEVDVSGQSTPPSTTIGAIVMASRKGDLGITDITALQDFDLEYGTFDPSWSYGHPCARQFLSASSNLKVLRVVNVDASSAWASVENDASGANGQLTRILPNAVGQFNDYTSIDQQTAHFSLSGPLVTGNTLSVPITVDNAPWQTISAVFATDNNTTLNNLVQSINQALNGAYYAVGSSPGFAQILPDLSGNNVNTEVRVVGPDGHSIGFGNITVSGGASQATAQEYYPKIFDVLVKNPGAWGNAVGISITEVNIGTAQRIQLNFSAAIATGQTVQLAFNSNGVTVNVPPVAYGVSSGTTMAAIAAAIKTALGGSADSYVVDSGSGANNNRQIVVVSPNDGANTLSCTLSQILGPSAGTIVSSTLLQGIANDDTFKVNVFTRANINVPAESYVVSLKHQVDGFGTQQFIEDVINTGNQPSDYIRVKVSSDNTAGTILATGLTQGIVWLTGGNDGSLPTNSQISAGWDQFADSEQVDMAIMINAGYNAPVVLQKMSSIAATRKDCFAFLDMPSDQQTASAAAYFRNNTLNVDTSFAAIFSPDIEITDSLTDRKLFIPPSGHVAAAYAAVDANYAVWFAAAGIKRGNLSNVTNLRVKYNKGDRDILARAQVNAIKLQRNGAGICIWDVLTLQSYLSLLSFIPVRRLLTYLQRTILTALEQEEFDPTNDQTMFVINQQLNGILLPIKQAGGLRNFLVVCDSRNNGAPNLDAGQLNVTVYFTPVSVARTIVLKSIITGSDVQFAEYITQGII